MKQSTNFFCRFASAVTAISILSFFSAGAYAADDDAPTVAFPDKWMVRVGAYIVDGSKTQVSLSSNTLLGTTIDYQRDLGGEDGDTIPRIDAYYRFNERHRIDFTSFSIDRKGQTTLAIDITIEDEVFSIGETVRSDIEYTLYKLGYSYSFYHSPKVELSFTAGINFTSYELSFQNSTGTKFEKADVTVPLPMFGLRMGYAITPKWSVNYISESFFIEIDDAFSGALLNNEVNTEYRLFKNFALGAGFARIGLDVDVTDDDWSGSVTDAYNGFTVFGTLYF